MTVRNRLPMSRLRCLLPGLLLLAQPVLAQAGDAFKALCQERLPAPSLKIQRQENGYQVEHKLSFRELTGMGEDLLRHGKQNVLGLTQTETGATVEMRLARIQDDESGRECMSPQVVISIGYKPIKVFIGREFPSDSCSYREILLHEMRHVHAYQRHLPLIEAEVRSQLAKRFPAQILYGKANSLEARMKAEIYELWLPMVDAEIRKISAIQAEIDTAEEYDRMERVCDGEVQHFLSASD